MQKRNKQSAEYNGTDAEKVQIPNAQVPQHGKLEDQEYILSWKMLERSTKMFQQIRHICGERNMERIDIR